MAEKGYIKLHRKVWENPIFSSGERFDRRSAWIYMLTHANYRDGSFMKNGRIYHLQRGQLFTSIRYLAQIWGWDRKTVMRFLRDTETEKMITQTGTQNGTLITIVNYSKYQASDDSESEHGTTEGTTERTANSTTQAPTERTTTKEEHKKNIKKSKEKTRGGQVIE